MKPFILDFAELTNPEVIEQINVVLADCETELSKPHGVQYDPPYVKAIKETLLKAKSLLEQDDKIGALLVCTNFINSTRPLGVLISGVNVEPDYTIKRPRVRAFDKPPRRY